MNVCRDIIRTSRFNKDYAEVLMKGCSVEVIEETITLLSEHRNSECNRDHKLKGKWEGYRECHILGTKLGKDLILIYRFVENDLVLELMRIGKHDKLNASYNRYNRMELLKENIDSQKLPSEEKYLDWQTYYYGIGEEVILTQVIDEQDCFAVDTITEIVINKDGIRYYFEEAEVGVHQSDIIAYTGNNIKELQEKGYQWVRPYMIMN